MPSVAVFSILVRLQIYAVNGTLLSTMNLGVREPAQ